MKNILLISFAFNSSVGSEALCGWKTAETLSKTNNVYVICSPWSQNECDIPNIVIIPFKINKIKKLQDLGNTLNYFKYYKKWLKELSNNIDYLCEKYNIDIIHQVTLGDFRKILYVKKRKFIFGPVGGAQKTPFVLLKRQKIINIIKDFARVIYNNLIINSHRYKKCINSASLVLCANKETLDFLSKKYKKVNFRLLTENGSQEQNLENISKDNVQKINVLWMGRFLYRKGLDIIIDVARNSKLNNNVLFNLYGNGKYKNHIQKKINKYQLKNINIFDSISHDLVGNIYQSNDLFLFPSIRETTGTVIFEAMSYGLPVASFNQNGAALIIKNKQNGFLVDIKKNYYEMIDDFVEIINDLNKYTNLSKYRDSCIETINKYSWERKNVIYDNIYEEVLNDEKDKNNY